MKRWVWIGLLLVAVPLLLAACNGSEGTVRRTVEDTAKAVETGLNRRNLSAVEPFFATTAEGANQAGLEETWRALRGFADTLGSSDQVQFHSFAVQSVSVHEEAGLARVTYRLHVSLIRNARALFSAVLLQDVALVKTPRGWRISGGDAPQLSDVMGQWPPAGQ